MRGLVKRFGGRTVVDHFSIQVERGQIYGFLGPNGSGKTTTIRMLCGLLTPDEGTGTCLGHDIVREAWAIKRQVGYMTQQFSLYEDLSIEENLDFVARLYAMDRAARSGWPRRWSGWGSPTAATSWPARCRAAGSSGWRWPPASCTSPKLLLLDEPTAGVDPKARREFWDEIHRLAADGMTVLVSTHYMDEAERCHRIAYIAYGRLLTSGTVAEVVARSGLVTWQAEGEGDRRRWRGRCAASPASRWWRRSARRCTSAAPTPRRWRPRSRPGASGAGLAWQRDRADAGGRVHPPDGQARRTTSHDRPAASPRRACWR